jgi:simple sugar transport system permease protein
VTADEADAGRASARTPPAAQAANVKARDLIGRIVRRPEVTPVGGALAVWAFFAVVAGDTGFLTGQGTANYLEVASQLGLITIAVTLLMIAGEFDLSVGSMLGAAGVLMAYPVAELGWPLWAGIALAFAGAALVGAINGLLVIRTGLPSFIVTLAALFILRGVTIAFTHDVTGGSTQVGGVREAVSGSFLYSALAGELFGLPAAVYWWLGLTAVATVVLARTRFGNWVYGAGGDPAAAARLGVPVARVKVLLFVLTALAASLVAVIGVLVNGAADVQQGQLKEFQAITAAVIGGTLLTGGYGTVVGAAFGALIFGMVSQGIFFTGADADWFQAFLGAMLLSAVLVNRYFGQQAQGG